MFGQASPVAHLQCQQLKMCHAKIAEKSFKNCILYIVLYLESLWKATSPFMWNWYKRRPEKELEAANKGPEIIVPLDVLPRVKCQATKNLQLGGESKNSWSAFVFLCRQPDPVRLSLGGQNRLGVVLSGLHYSTDSSYLVLSVVLDDKYQWKYERSHQGYLLCCPCWHVRVRRLLWCQGPPTHRKRRQRPAKNVLKLLCLLYSVSGSKSRLPNTFVVFHVHHIHIFMDIMEVQEPFKEYETYLHADDGVDEEEHGDE